MTAGRTFTALALVLLTGCSDRATGEAVSSSSTSTNDVDTTLAPVATEPSPKLDIGAGTTADVEPNPANAIDLLLVVDDAPSMREEQTSLARSFLEIGRTLAGFTDSAGVPVDLDLHVMVTSTSVDQPACPGRSSAGAPVTTPCSERLSDFADLAAACEDVCPDPIAPAGDFIVSTADGDNFGPVVQLDLDDDGIAESPLARALACLGPQGVAGCAYGSPLEAMRRALDSSAEWNAGAEPFLRAGAPLVIIVITDGVDCSGADGSTLDDVAFWEIDPISSRPAPSSAICWNAGVSCDGLDPDGIYSGCVATPTPLTATSEYAASLDVLRTEMDKEILMLGLVGVPVVTEHSVGSPFHPTEGGVDALVVREWVDADLTLSDAAAGITVEDKSFALGIGPGCTGLDEAGNAFAQALPPIRLVEVCQSLDLSRDEWDARCCLESICDADASSTLNCLHALMPQVIYE